MADNKKTTKLDELSTLASTDLIIGIDDVSGTPTTTKVELDTLDDYLSASEKTLTNKTLTSPKINEDVAVTSTASELNILDGVTADKDELNILDGVTATATEINVLDDIPETLTSTELGYVDGVTSAIQTQMNLKAPLASPTFTGTVVLPNSQILTTPVLNTSFSGTAKATGAEINTGTEDAKIVTPKAIADSWVESSWIPAREDWAYASATTITVPAGAADIYSKGDKIKFVQSAAWKYFYITAVASTLLTVTGGSSYTVADSAITENAYSHAESPLGFPLYFNYDLAWTATTTNPVIGNGTLIGRFTIIRNMCYVNGHVLMGSTTTFGTDRYHFSLPITPASTWYGILGNMWAIRSGVAHSNLYLGFDASADLMFINQVDNVYLSPTTPNTWANADKFAFNVIYQI